MSTPVRIEVIRQQILTVNLDEMVTFRKKRPYEDPRTKVTQADLEGLICASVMYLVETDELRNINAEVDADGNTVESLYFEF